MIPTVEELKALEDRLIYASHGCCTCLASGTTALQDHSVTCRYRVDREAADAIAAIRAALEADMGVEEQAKVYESILVGVVSADFARALQLKLAAAEERIEVIHKAAYHQQERAEVTEANYAELLIETAKERGMRHASTERALKAEAERDELRRDAERYAAKRKSDYEEWRENAHNCAPSGSMFQSEDDYNRDYDEGIDADERLR